MTKITRQTKNIIARIFNKFFLDYIQSSRRITELIFGVTPYPRNRDEHWDLTTIVLKKALNKYVKDHQKILEIGTGDLAILSIYIAKKYRDLDITAVDINPEFVINAKLNANKNKVKLNIFQSDLFSNVNSLFDVIFFNPPYVPTHNGSIYEVEKRNDIEQESIYNKIWDGGEEGCDVIRRFLQNVSKNIFPDGKIILGINTFFIDDSKIKEIVNENNLNIISIISQMFNPSKAYILSLKHEDK